MGSSAGAEFADATVLPSTSYTYTIQAVDYHGNVGAGTSVTVTTPAAGAIDPRRVGLSNTGSYWGGGGEQIDTLSGNLHFSLPVLEAQGRPGWKTPVGLVYDSQNWRQDGGQNWQLGDDVGFGFGWKMLIGSITPYYTQYFSGVDHYVYTDSTGAEYRLDVNAGGVWSSTKGIYVWFDSNTNILHFRNGMFWVMGCTSGGLEPDAGTMYPTIIEDVSGNQVIITYDTAVGLPYYSSPYWNLYTSNTSSRIAAIEDVRASGCGAYGCTEGVTRATWVFTYDRTNYATPHLTQIASRIGTGETFSASYASAPLGPPFGADPSYAGSTTCHLISLTTATALPYQFTYDPAGAGELTQVTFPSGGHLRWTHTTDAYSGVRALRAVTNRFLAADAAGANEWSYTITRDSASASTQHSTATLVDASGVGAKTWNFLTPATTSQAWQFGLVSEFVQKASSTGTVYTDDTYTWSQDPAGNPYISAKTSKTDPGTSYQQSAKTTQALDQYGNTNQSATYPYNDTSAPLRTFTSTFLNSGTYPQHYILDRLLTTTLTTGGAVKTLVTNTYDGNSHDRDCGSFCSPNELDAHPPIAPNQRGYLATSVTPAVTTSYGYQYGKVNSVSGSDGTTLQSNLPASTNYAAPTTITTQTYGETIGYNSWLGVTQTTGLNGEQLYLTYDGIGRPTTATSPYGATTNFAYAAAVPLWQTKTGPDGFTRTTLDGLGRAIRVERGPDSLHIQSVVDTVYAPCACSPLGKVQKVSMPYQPGAATINWTVYRYDGIGRTVAVTQPDGASTTTYMYSGNQTTVTDPAGKWKTFTTDVQGNLTTVTEPDPSSATGGTLTTSYTYDWMNHLTGVSMPRGGITQTRSFVYNDAGLLNSATNPESGTVTYTYNADNTLNSKHDAKGQDTVYTYDSKKRVTVIQRYPHGKTAPEDTSQRVTYQYDTNTQAPDFALYLTGRLATAQYTIVDENGNPSPVTEMYAYHPAGAVTAKRLTAMGCGTGDGVAYGCSPAYVEADYTYNSAGQVATYGMARNSSSTLPTDPTYTYVYDAMGRPTTLTDDQSGLSGGGTPNTVWAKNAQYDFAGRMTSLQTYGGIYYTGIYQPAYETETSTWNVNGQLASRGWISSIYSASASGTVQYTYSATQINGQITQASDSLSGETISYQYDSLKRLVSAASAPNTGTTPAAWTQAFQYDGFGNLTAKVLNGGTTAIPVNGSTNRLANAIYDANGNMTSGAGVMPGYDVANRMTSAQLVSGGTEYYGYAPDNKRIYRNLPGAFFRTTDWTFYGAYGEKLGVFNLGGSPSGASFQVLHASVWFAGRLVAEDATNPFASGLSAVRRDRLGSNRAGGARFYPYGEEIGTKTVDDRTTFATYTRDGMTGLDFTDQRFYAFSYGRFNTPDPNKASGSKKDPGSWNRYSYVGNDPINFNDPRGLAKCSAIGSYTTRPDPDDALREVTYADIQCTSAGGTITVFGGWQEVTGTAGQLVGDWESSVGKQIDFAEAVASGRNVAESRVADCSASLFAGLDTSGPNSPLAILKSVIYKGTDLDPLIRAQSGLYPLGPNDADGLPTLVPSIAINTAGAFANGTYSDIYGLAAANPNASSFDVQNLCRGITLIHELGHILTQLGYSNPILNDAGNAGQSGKNSALAAEKCFGYKP